MRLNSKVVLTVASLALGVAAYAQPVISAKAGVVSRAEGEVFIADKALENSQATFPEVKENSILSTKQGRAEVLLTRGVYMRMGESACPQMCGMEQAADEAAFFIAVANDEATEKFNLENNSMHPAAGGCGMGAAGGSAPRRKPGTELQSQ